MSDDINDTNKSKRIVEGLEDTKFGTTSTITMGKQSTKTLTTNSTNGKRVSTFSSTQSSYSITKTSKKTKNIISELENCSNEKEDIKQDTPQKLEINFSTPDGNRLKEPNVEKNICTDDVIGIMEDDKQESQPERNQPPEKSNSEKENINEDGKNSGLVEEYKSFLAERISDMKSDISTMQNEEMTNIENEPEKYSDENTFLDNKISDVGCEFQIDEAEEVTTGVLEKVDNSKNDILETEACTNKTRALMSKENNQELSPNDFGEQTFDNMYGVMEGSACHENKILENDQILSDEKLVSISRQSSADEGRQNALLFLVIVTLLAILIEALYNLFFTA